MADDRDDTAAPLDRHIAQRAQIETATRSLWRYRAALPLLPDDPITMGEGCTPLIRRTLHGSSVLLKCEWFMPTGSFKDRGASVMLSLLRAQGVREVLEDSSGNGGAAVAAYAAAGGMHAMIMAPASTSPAKTVQMRAYGVEIELVPGTRQDTADEAVRQAEAIFYASHNWQAFFLQGTKTLAYELWEDLFFQAPDNIVIPTGAGSNVLGLDIGFGELLRRGEIARLRTHGHSGRWGRGWRHSPLRAACIRSIPPPLLDVLRRVRRSFGIRSSPAGPPALPPTPPPGSP